MTESGGTPAEQASTSNESLTGLYDAVVDSVVEIRVRTPTESSQGSGFVFEEGVIVIVGIDGHAIHTSQDLARYLLIETRPGSPVSVTVLRDGERTTETVTPGERPEPGVDPV